MMDTYKLAQLKQPVHSLSTIIWIGMVERATPEYVVATAKEYGYETTIEDVLSVWKKEGYLPETSIRNKEE